MKTSLKKILFLYDDINLAPDEGLVGLGGKVDPDFILKYYPKGIFPWFKEGDIPIWFSPDPRWILYPEKVKISHSLKSLMRKNKFTISSDTCFKDVVAACAKTKRKDTNTTWIDEDFKSCFIELHHMGYAHSIEVFNQNNQLVGGLFGVAIGRMFSGESMFFVESGASKVALVLLCKFLLHHNYAFIDCQTHTQHLQNMGAEPIPRAKFLQVADEVCKTKGLFGSWKKHFEEWLLNDMNHTHK